MADLSKQQRRTSLIGWSFVAAQFILIALIVISPSATDWATPSWLVAFSWVLFGLGCAVMAVAALRLGWSLTPTPVPRSSGQLQTGGLYRYSRHPIYSGLLAVVLAITIRSGSLVTAALAMITIAFFNAKARWEEQRLADNYPDYSAYAAGTPRFVPSLKSIRGRDSVS